MILRANVYLSTITQGKQYEVMKNLPNSYVIIDDAGKRYDVPKIFITNGNVFTIIETDDEDKEIYCSNCRDGGCIYCSPKDFI